MLRLRGDLRPGLPGRLREGLHRRQRQAACKGAGAAESTKRRLGGDTCRDTDLLAEADNNVQKATSGKGAEFFDIASEAKQARAKIDIKGDLLSRIDKFRRMTVSSGTEPLPMNCTRSPPSLITALRAAQRMRGRALVRS